MIDDSMKAAAAFVSRLPFHISQPVFLKAAWYKGTELKALCTNGF